MQHAHFSARAQYVGQEDRIFHILLGEQALNTHLGGPRSCEASFAGCWTRWICRACLWGLSRPVPHLGVSPGGGFSIFNDHRGEVEGYRGAETIIDQDRVDLFRMAFGLLHPSAVYGQAARDLCPGRSAGCPTGVLAEGWCADGTRGSRGRLCRAPGAADPVDRPFGTRSSRA